MDCKSSPDMANTNAFVSLTRGTIPLRGKRFSAFVIESKGLEGQGDLGNYPMNHGTDEGPWAALRLHRRDDRVDHCAAPTPSLLKRNSRGQ